MENSEGDWLKPWEIVVNVGIRQNRGEQSATMECLICGTACYPALHEHQGEPFAWWIVCRNDKSHCCFPASFIGAQLAPTRRRIRNAEDKSA